MCPPCFHTSASLFRSLLHTTFAPYTVGYSPRLSYYYHFQPSRINTKFGETTTLENIADQKSPLSRSGQALQLAIPRYSKTRTGDAERSHFLVFLPAVLRLCDRPNREEDFGLQGLKFVPKSVFRNLDLRSGDHRLNIGGTRTYPPSKLCQGRLHPFLWLHLRNRYGGATLVVGRWPLLAAHSKPSRRLTFKLRYSAHPFPPLFHRRSL